MRSGRLALRIALRYLLARKSHSAVNVISVISVAGVAVATAAIVVVLSVFNGFADLSARHLSKADPALMVTPAKGKVIADADSLAAAVASVPGVTAAMPSLQERALLISGNTQLPVIFKGVTADYQLVTDFDDVIVDGAFISDTVAPYPSQLSVGVAARAGLRPATESIADIYVPRRRGRINPANPATAFTGTQIMVTGISQIDQLEYDADRIVIPLAAARRLLDYTTEASAMEIALNDRYEQRAIARKISAAIGPDYRVATRLEQRQDSFRMIAVEKWVTFLMLAFILVIASFNIVSTLSLLVIEKRDNMATLRALGASRRAVSAVFMAEGWLITVAGGVCGIVLGLALSLAQQFGGFIKLGADPDALTIDVYPVLVAPADIAIVAALIVAVAALASLTTRLFTRSA